MVFKIRVFGGFVVLVLVFVFAFTYINYNFLRSSNKNLDVRRQKVEFFFCEVLGQGKFSYNFLYNTWVIS